MNLEMVHVFPKVLYNCSINLKSLVARYVACNNALRLDRQISWRRLRIVNKRLVAAIFALAISFVVQSLEVRKS